MDNPIAGRSADRRSLPVDEVDHPCNREPEGDGDGRRRDESDSRNEVSSSCADEVLASAHGAFFDGMPSAAAQSGTFTPLDRTPTH